MALSEAEIERYGRHILLREVGGPGQARLKAARVLVVGAGGLGSPVLSYLAAAGVGTLGVVDDDTVALSNLQRQILHDTASVGRPKIASAAESVARLNPHVRVEGHECRLTAANAMALIEAYELVVDGSDNFATRYLVADACHLARRTLVHGAVGPFEGQVSTFKPHLAGPDGTPFPSYRCLYPEPPPAGAEAPCAVAGVLGAVVGVVGTLMAVETLKELLGIGTGLAGRLLLYDARAGRMDEIPFGWNPDNPLSGRAPTIRDLSGHG